MRVRDFQRKIKELPQWQIDSIGMSVITKILVEKGICTKTELQDKFLEIAKERSVL